MTSRSALEGERKQVTVLFADVKGSMDLAEQIDPEEWIDRDYSDQPPEQRNGYTFHQADGYGIESAMRRGIGLWYSYPQDFRYLMFNGLRYDYSWNHPAQDYLNIYEYIRHK